MRKKIIFFVIWLALLILVPVTVFKVTPLALITKYPATLMNFLQRVIGLTLFILLFVQIILGAFMTGWIKKFGEWIFSFHVFEGRLIYLLAILHPIFFILLNHYVGLGFDPYKAFINICLLCSTRIDYYYTLGRISFWLLTVVVFAVVFKNISAWLKANWRKLHVLNYVVFLLVGAHGFFIGTDFQVQPFFSFAIVAYAIIAGIVVFIEIPRLYKNFREWLKN